MIREIKVSLFDLVLCLSDTTDLISPAITNHHKEVAYIALSLAKEIGLSSNRQNNILIGSALHDIGALSLRDKLDVLEFEIKDQQRVHKHAEIGYLLLKKFSPFSAIESLVRFHHVPWNEGDGAEFKGKCVPVDSHILHLADRVAILINKQENILGQVNTVCEKIKIQSGKMFVPELVDAFIVPAWEG